MKGTILFEERVKNAVNKTNIEYFGIFGLFDRYNVEIPFDKQVYIFIGENGLGKTTILNCIYYTLEGKISKLASLKFIEIRIKFKNDSKLYIISKADIQEYEKQKRHEYTHRRFDFYEHSILDDVLPEQLFELYSNSDIEDAIRKVSFKLDIPPKMAKNLVMEYIYDRESRNGQRRKANSDNVAQLIKAVASKITHRIIYLPTYRRIEDDFASLNLSSKELNSSELLIRFGMSDVQKSIDAILEKIRSLAMEGFTEMTGVLLKQYADGEDPLKTMFQKYKIEEDVVKIVLDRVGDKIAQNDKKRILSLIESDEIFDRRYVHLLNLLNKLIVNYDLQKKYDDKIKRFTDTCNKYLMDKHLVYNQSTLDLNVCLDKDSRNVINLTQLSSGEKQIVSLFSKLYLEDDDKRSIVIIDEPELSLSLQWQKMLLPDVMRTDNCDLLLTVTHSPFIFENEFDYDAKEIRDYIKTLKRSIKHD